jgi:hypothetical protein
MSDGVATFSRLLPGVLTIVCVLFHSTAAQGATFNVADGDVPGLISAIHAANSTAEPDTIVLAPAGTYTLVAVAEDDGFAGGAGLPYIRNPLTIQGQGATIQRSLADGIPDFRIVFVFVTDLALDALTISGGRGGNGNRGGGGIGITTGRLVVTNSTVTNNISLGDGGGGIASYCGVLTIENTTISHNTGLGGRTGGGLLNWSAPPACYARATIVSSTIFENRAADPNLGGRGDAIADAFSSPQPSVTLQNSIVASPATGIGDDCYVGAGVLVSAGGNIASDGSCGLAAADDANGADPQLGPLADNGGLTPTHLPLVGSPATDRVPLPFCNDAQGSPLTVDQRGTVRPQGTACDTGSVEAHPVATYNVCLLYDPTKAVRSGATIPVKLQLCDEAGSNLSSQDIALHGSGIVQSSTTISGVLQDSGNANPDLDFRFDPTLGGSGGYVFNLSTKGLSTGTYQLNFAVAAEPAVYAVPFQVK